MKSVRPSCILTEVTEIRSLFTKGLQMTAIEEGLNNNARYAKNFDKGDLPLPPARNLAVVACMDARLDIHKLLGLQEGDARLRQ